MFDTIASPVKRRSRTATAGSIALHGGAIVIALVLAGLRTEAPPPLPEPRLVPPRFPIPQASGRSGNSQPPPVRDQTRARPPRVNLSREVAPAPEPPPGSAVEAAPAAATQVGSDATDRPGVSGDMGPGGGGEDFTPTGPEPTLEYDGRMTPPRQISGPDPEYTLQALQSDVQGVMVVKCIVTVEGAVHGCRVLQGLPFMDRAVMEALERRRYLPARLAGRPVEVDYTFRIRLQLPQ
jgi:periplasmic protein TonB